MFQSPYVRVERSGRLGRLTLDRPKSLNALTHEMIRAIHVALDLWRADDTIAAASPTSRMVAFRQLRRGAYLTLEHALRVEYRLSLRLTWQADFCEGVRAALIDRHRAPKWSPADFEEIEEDSLNALFCPLGEGRELELG